MQTIVINLARESGRWAAVRRQFEAAGLDPQRHEAVAGDTLPAEQVARLYSTALNERAYHRPLRPGEVGCYASHLAVWQRLLDGPDACAAVFEDDVTIDPRLGRVLEVIARLARAPELHWDMVKLIGRLHEQPAARAPLAGAAEPFELVAYRRVPSLTGGYVVTRRGAQKLLAHRRPFGRPVDVDLRHWWECGLVVLGVQPYPVGAAPSSVQTTIEGRYGRPDAATRLHKLALQAHYTWHNTWHRWRARPQPLPQPHEAGSRLPRPEPEHP